MRDPAAIRSEIAATEKLLGRLRRELRAARSWPAEKRRLDALEARKQRNFAIVTDRLNGMSRDDIALKHGLTYGVVNNVIYDAQVARQNARLRKIAERHAPQQATQ